MNKPKKKPERRTMWFNVAKVLRIDTGTGEILQPPIRSLVARDGITRRMMKARGYHIGDELKGVVTKGRNYSQWKRAHALGLLVATQIEGFEPFANDGHGCIKELQKRSGIACDTVDTTIDAKPIVDAIMNGCEGIVGKVRAAALRALLPQLETLTMQQTEPRSLSYESMGDEDFQTFYADLCRYIIKTWWHEMTPEQIETMADCMGQENLP